ncbi:MAG: hypothetical protein IJW40_03790 [Clostridia bacterium]|nr:hypothetical protein [Clostridia bacterium]
MTKIKKLHCNRSGKLFSLPLFLQGIKKLRVPGIAMAISVIGLNVLFPLITAASDRSRVDYYNSLQMEGWGVYEPIPTLNAVDTFSEFAPLSMLLLAFAPLLAFLMFSYLNDRGKSDFYHAIPQTRLCVYFSFTASIVAWLSAVLLVSTSLNLLLWQLAIYHTVAIGEALALMLCILLGALLTMSIAILAMTLTGTTVSNLFVAVLIFLVARIVFWECFEALYDIIPVYDLDRSWTRLLTFDNYYPIALFLAVVAGSSSSEQVVFDGAIIAYTVVLTVVLLALGAVCYHIRRSEMANQSAPNKYLQHVYRCAVTIPLLLFVVIDAMLNGLDVDHIWVAVIALILYLLYELTTTKKLRNLPRTLPVFGILIAVCMVLYGGLYAMHAVISVDVPAKESVKSVAISPIQLRLDDDRFDMDDLAIADEEAIDIVIDALAFSAPMTRQEYYDHISTLEHNMTNKDIIDYDTPDDYLSYGGINVSYTPTSYKSVDVQINLKLGRTLHRTVWMEESAYERLRTIYYATETYRDAYLSMPEESELYSLSVSTMNDYLQLKETEIKPFYTMLCNEYYALTVDEKMQVKDFSYNSNDSALPRVHLYGYYSANTDLVLSPEFFPRTVAYIVELEKEVNHGGSKKAAEYLSEILANILALENDDFYVINSKGETKYYTYFDLALTPMGTYQDQQKELYNSGYYPHRYQLSFDTSDYYMSVKDFDYLAALQSAASVLEGASDLFDYENTGKQLYYLEISYSDLPAELSLNKSSFDSFYGYVSLTSAEASALNNAIRHNVAISDPSTEKVVPVE